MTRSRTLFAVAAALGIAMVPAVMLIDARAQTSAEPFPPGARIAFVDVLRVARQSTEGRAAAAQLEALSDSRVEDLTARLKTLQARLEPGQAPADEAGRLALRREIEQGELELRRALRDAQNEMVDLDERLRLDFSRRLGPIIRQVALDRQVHIVLPVQADFLWAHPGLDVTDEVMTRFNAGR
jgi:Skp family chaperone for outer membrane proteins